MPSAGLDSGGSVGWLGTSAAACGGGPFPG